MAQIDLIMPKMGESIVEATILNWLKEVGDQVKVDENILEIATDKVDSEIPSPVDGKISEILFKKDDVVEVGTVIARIEAEGEEVQASPAVEESSGSSNGSSKKSEPKSPPVTEPAPTPVTASHSVEQEARPSQSTRFYSPLVRNIAQKEGITVKELDTIQGTGLNDRVTKFDIMSYVEERKDGAIHKAATAPATLQAKVSSGAAKPATSTPKVTAPASGDDEIIEMSRMRKLIANHMVMSKQTSPHVTSFVESDVTDLVNWRDANKKAFLDLHGQKITYTPIFMEAVAKAIHDFPMINISVRDDEIIRKKNVNIGMATALPTGELIVPVIRNADQLNLTGLTKQVNDLATRARNHDLKPEEIQDGTFTLTNVGTFGNVMGTPIINQPQVAILATGAIRKKPAVLETDYGDVIAVRQMMFLSLSYDHRVVDGFLGGSFLRRVADYLERFDVNRSI